MRRVTSVLSAFPIALSVLSGQAPIPTGLVRGVLLQPASASPGQFIIESGGELLYRFSFDSRTWIEKDQERIPATALLRGEILEVVCDRDPSPLRYARMVHVVEKTSPVRPLQSGMYRLRRSPVEFIAPRGDLTFSGIISTMTGTHLVLRTRFDGEKMVLLRKDTFYLADGFQVEPGVLKPNTRVFMRAGKNLDDEIEAYQVIWGEIFEPLR